MPPGTPSPRCRLLRGSLAIGWLQCLHVVHQPAELAGFLDTSPGLDIAFV
jgi:hypothetical protein